MFSCEFYEIFKNTVFYGTPPVAASVKDRHLKNYASKSIVHVMMHANF